MRPLSFLLALVLLTPLCPRAGLSGQESPPTAPPGGLLSITPGFFYGSSVASGRAAVAVHAWGPLRPWLAFGYTDLVVYCALNVGLGSGCDTKGWELAGGVEIALDPLGSPGQHEFFLGLSPGFLLEEESELTLRGRIGGRLVGSFFRPEASVGFFFHESIDLAPVAGVGLGILWPPERG